MKTMNLTRGLFISVLSVVAAGIFLLTPLTSEAATCSFTRDLQLGVTGDDVKCLQQYLNEAGFKIAETGAGSAGKETGEFKTLTQAAVIKWQEAHKVSPALGYFGLKSRTAYKAALSGGTVPSTPAVTGGSQAQINLIDQVAALQAKKKK